jgi:hypothetical protein
MGEPKGLLSALTEISAIVQTTGLPWALAEERYRSALKEEVLAEAPTHDAVTLCANSDGKPWTVSGFRTSWRPIRLELQRARNDRPRPHPVHAFDDLLALLMSLFPLSKLQQVRWRPRALCIRGCAQISPHRRWRKAERCPHPHSHNSSKEDSVKLLRRTNGSSST